MLFLTLILGGLITAWYRANQLNHFARHTHLDDATFRLTTSGKGIMWLLFSNWLLSVLGVLAGVVAGGALAWAAGVLPDAPQPGVPPQPALAALLLMAAPVVVLTTIATTFARLRSARYFLSRLKARWPRQSGCHPTKCQHIAQARRGPKPRCSISMPSETTAHYGRLSDGKTAASRDCQVGWTSQPWRSIPTTGRCAPAGPMTPCGPANRSGLTR